MFGLETTSLYQIAKLERCGNFRSRNLTYKFCTGTVTDSTEFISSLHLLRIFCIKEGNQRTLKVSLIGLIFIMQISFKRDQ